MRNQIMIIFQFFLIASIAYADTNTPGIGAAVRFQAEELGPGWHRGFFNQQRTVPPCYLVMTFTVRTSSEESLRVSATVPISRVNRLQASSVIGVSMQAWDGLALPDIPEQSWREVDLKPLLPEEGQCVYEDWSAEQL